MNLLRIQKAAPLEGFRLQLTLNNGQEVEREVAHLLTGPVFEVVRNQPGYFEQVQVEAGTVAWPNGADLCPDTVIWGGAPPVDENAVPPSFLAVMIPA